MDPLDFELAPSNGESLEDANPIYSDVNEDEIKLPPDFQAVRRRGAICGETCSNHLFLNRMSQQQRRESNAGPQISQQLEHLLCYVSDETYERTSFETSKIIHNAVSSCCAAPLSLCDCDVEELCQLFVRIDTPKGTSISNSSYDGCCLFVIVEQGELQVLDVDPTTFRIVVLRDIRRGGYYGGNSLLHAFPSTQSLVCATDCHLWVLPRSEFVTKLVQMEQSTRFTLDNAISSVSRLVNLNKEERSQVIDAFREEYFAPGATIVLKGQCCDEICVLLHGKLGEMSEKDQSRHVTYSSGSIFFSRALSGSMISSVTLVADRACCCAFLERKVLKKILGERYRQKIPRILRSPTGTIRSIHAKRKKQDQTHRSMMPSSHQIQLPSCANIVRPAIRNTSVAHPKQRRRVRFSSPASPLSNHSSSRGYAVVLDAPVLHMDSPTCTNSRDNLPPADSGDKENNTRRSDSILISSIPSISTPPSTPTTPFRLLPTPDRVLSELSEGRSNSRAQTDSRSVFATGNNNNYNNMCSPLSVDPQPLYLLAKVLKKNNNTISDLDVDEEMSESDKENVFAIHNVAPSAIGAPANTPVKNSLAFAVKRSPGEYAKKHSKKRLGIFKISKRVLSNMFHRNKGVSLSHKPAPQTSGPYILPDPEM